MKKLPRPVSPHSARVLIFRELPSHVHATYKLLN